jgi:hypothetical protein
MPDGYLEPVSTRDVVERVQESVDDLFAFAAAAAKKFAEAGKDVGSKAAEVELGLKFTAKGTVYVAETTGEASIRVKFTF